MLSLTALLVALAGIRTTPTPTPGQPQVALTLEPSANSFPRSTSVEFRLMVRNVAPNGKDLFIDPFVLSTGFCWRPGIDSSFRIEVRDSEGAVVTRRSDFDVADCREPFPEDFMRVRKGQFYSKSFWLGGEWPFKKGRYTVKVRLTWHLQTFARQNPDIVKVLADTQGIDSAAMTALFAEGTWESPVVPFEVGGQ